MHGAKAMPDVDGVAIIDPAVRGEGLEAQERPPDGFEKTGAVGPAGISRLSRVVVGIESRSGNPRASFLREGRDIQNVIEMTVREDDAFDGLLVPTALMQGASQKRDATDEPSINEVEARIIAEHMEIQGRRPDSKNIITHKEHTLAMFDGPACKMSFLRCLVFCISIFGTSPGNFILNQLDTARPARTAKLQ